MMFNMVTKICDTVLLAIWFADLVAGNSRTNFQVTRFELCNATQGTIKFHGNVTKQNGDHFMSFNISTAIAWDENVGGVVPIYTKTIGSTFTELFVIREKSICKAANMYLGELWYDIQRAAQFPTGVCPVPAGKYHGHHILLDFKKMKLQTFPFGPMRFIMNWVDNRNKNRVLMCLLAEVINMPD